ncbi:hypothetical protein A3H65_00800 [Candidatus Giovannonibacteria bacterium RIFCSPLOWO2_02_FULL_45_14]|uniref:Addiction module toxin RelE n=1 Tax=Candidatus Giovannonibacteria bacterium RIFCSPLOWO2_12_FULL_44_15 TaxID=1798364 RepID=A0A1F5XYZ4_9BACT|nr:MAG: hypothetical protein A3C75_02075 [Candidatus Giovannonibacteria bacterium RIFCSPHIGHO2_02_FULL_44_31]OGF77100.1 MAG: hypothetical protein A3E62_01575 [Candidatus Giovannonibacteria bacterium RIFCSPHIGHO2_12_FULL_44_29]OGF91310.1 MAG: hypothetical protein A3H65_00800 [Candidatus Giovannonibacteria bacterium RIFCSPLOWO2_02_FULL_45_14]OGF93134.1 MAG: hypothetical protein A3G54_03145 [Candidatus Giovannonibacteria bacterium RIFCSPLOWO2_12_FULL_44_15]
MNFDETDEFSRDFRRLSKKYKSLHGDLLEFKKIVTALPLGSGKHFNIITKTERITVIKARLFCQYLRGSSLRIIYALQMEISKIEFIQIYPKNEQENEDRERIKEYLENHN